MSLEIPLGEQEHLKEFFELAEQHFKDDRLKSYETFIQYVDSMERQCADMCEEIGYLKEQLQDMANNRLKSKLETLFVSIQEPIYEVGSKIKDIKTGISGRVKEILAGSRQGKNFAIARLLEGLQVKEHLESVRGYVKKANQTLEVGLKELEQAERKMEEAKIQKKEAIAILRGKEIKREKGKDRKGILQKTLLYMKGLCEGMEQRSERMIQMIENIGNMPSQKPKVNWQERIHPKTNEGQPFPERGK